MKVQKLMFQNASHELKTPLNSIISSTRLAETKLHDLENTLSKLNVNEKVQDCIIKLKKYVLNISISS